MKYFGTDGIRGTYGDVEICEPFFYALGRAAAEYLNGAFPGNNYAVVGGDTRASTDTLKKAFVRGVTDGGARCEDVGVLPTPALAYCVTAKGAAMGAMITASHNPYTDNGIKFFDSNALKISDEVQLLLENLLGKYLDVSKCAPKYESFKPRKIELGSFALNDYAAKMSGIFGRDFLKGMRIAIDMANGATSGVSSEVLKSYGALVFEKSREPDGLNINENAGSQYPSEIARFCGEVGADVGFAHDGDGDRVIVVDDKCRVLAGEEILRLIAMDAKARGVLRGGAIVTTLQSNLGLDESLAREGVKVLRSGIGDRLVMKMMIDNGCNIGGENSGHFIFSEISPCGDGLAAALSVLSVMASKSKKLSQLRGGMEMYPTLSKALKVADKIPIDQTPTLAAAIARCDAELGSEGRTLVRYSGTEKKIRLLVEGKNAQKVQECMQVLEKSVENDLQ